MVFPWANYEFSVGFVPHSYNCFASVYIYDAYHCIH